MLLLPVTDHILPPLAACLLVSCALCICRRVLASLLHGPLSGGLSKLKPAGFVAVAVRLGRLGVPPPQRWLGKYSSQMQVRVWEGRIAFC